MSENKRNFLVHGGILAMAGILVRIIGMFYRIPLVNIIGSDGNGIYGAAYNVYNIMLVLSAYGLPMAVSKLVSAKFVAKQFKNAASIFKCADFCDLYRRYRSSFIILWSGFYRKCIL